MTQTSNTPNPQISAKLDATLVKLIIALCSLELESQLKGLSTANKNRVLLALHAQIGEQLDSLAANNDQ
jgi:hypothetical protein